MVDYHWLLTVSHHWGLPRRQSKSMALPLTAGCLSPLPMFRVCEEVASDMVLGDGVCQLLGFLHHLQLIGHDLDSLRQKKWR